VKNVTSGGGVAEPLRRLLWTSTNARTCCGCASPDEDDDADAAALFSVDVVGVESF